MKHSKRTPLFLTLSLIGLLAMFSCRKKDERYEGNYVGTERYTERDSGETIYSLDSTYHQEFEVTYDKKVYTFLKLFNSEDFQIFTAGKKSIIDHEYRGFGEIYYNTEGNEIGGAGSMKFVGDSMYVYSWSTFNGNEEVLEFKGKRN